MGRGGAGVNLTSNLGLSEEPVAPTLRAERQPREAAACPRSHSNPNSGLGPLKKAWRGENSGAAGLLSYLRLTDPTHHSKAKMKWTLWPKRESFRSGKADASDKRVRLHCKVTQFRSGSNRGAQELEGWVDTVGKAFQAAETA